MKIKLRTKGGFLADSAGHLFRTARTKSGNTLPAPPATAPAERAYSPEELDTILGLLTYKMDRGGGEAFFASGEPRTLYDLKPDPDRFTVSIHGNSKDVVAGDRYTADDMATWLQSKYSSWNGENIRLAACNAGNTTETSNPFAQQLADRLGVTVTGPDKYCHLNRDGTISSTSLSYDADGDLAPTDPPDGSFVDFHPRSRA